MASSDTVAWATRGRSYLGDYEEISRKFPNLTLEDKGNIEGGGNGGNPLRRSTRIRDQTHTMASLERAGHGEDHGDLVQSSQEGQNEPG